MAGVAVVLARGDPANLARLRLVPGDVYILAATLAWALYSWLLARPRPNRRRSATTGLPQLLAQVTSGWAGRACWRAANGC